MATETQIHEIGDLNPEIFEDVLKFMYTGHVRLRTMSEFMYTDTGHVDLKTMEDMLDVYCAADRLLIIPLVKYCSPLIKLAINEENVVAVYEFMQKYNEPDITNMADSVGVEFLLPFRP